MRHTMKSFVLNAKCRGARPTASVNSLSCSSEINLSMRNYCRIYSFARLDLTNDIEIQKFSLAFAFSFPKG